MKNLKALIEVATGRSQADVVAFGAQVLNVFTKEFEKVDLALCGGYIAAVGKRGSYSGKIELDCTDLYIVPSFIDAHVHIESSMLLPSEFMRIVSRFGTTAVIADSHEIGNVLGSEGVRFMINQAENADGDVYFMIPSCVPATDFEHTGGEITTDDIEKLLALPKVLGLGEMMNYPGIIEANSAVLEKIEVARLSVLDGHAPLLSDKNLQAYRSTGIKTDHECRTFDEALEKIRAGMWILLREGSSARDLEHIVPDLVKSGLGFERFAFCTDDKNAMDILQEGHIDHSVRTAIALGVPIETAYCMASINTAECYGLKDTGALCAGYKADFIVLSDAKKVIIQDVFKGGEKLSRLAHHATDEGSVLTEDMLSNNKSLLKKAFKSVRLDKIEKAMFTFGTDDSELEAFDRHIIKITPQTLNTESVFTASSEIKSGFESGNLCKVAVLERHKKTGHSGLCFVEGYGLNAGAIATSIGHDSHNIICAGANANDMQKAVEHLESIQGGICIVRDGIVQADFCLQLAGLMSIERAELVVEDMKKLQDEVKKLGVYNEMEPFVTLSFLALTVIPELRITDQGLFDVKKWKFIEK